MHKLGIEFVNGTVGAWFLDYCRSPSFHHFNFCCQVIAFIGRRRSRLRHVGWHVLGLPTVITVRTITSWSGCAPSVVHDALVVIVDIWCGGHAGEGRE